MSRLYPLLKQKHFINEETCMSESSNLYRGADRKAKDVSFTEKQESVSVKEGGWQLIFQQVKNKFEERKSSRSIEFRKICRERVNRFRDLRSIDSDFKVSHFRKVRRHIIKIAKVDFREELFLKNAINYLYVLGILGTVSPNWILTGSVLKKVSLFNWIGINLFYLLVISSLSFLIYFMLGLQSSEYEKSNYEKVIAVLFSLPIAAIWAAISRVFAVKYVDDSFFATFPLISTIGLISSVLISILLAEAIWIIGMFLTRPRKQYPESVLVNGLLEVLSGIEKESLCWSYNTRTQIWCKIKGLAKNLQRSYQGAFSSNKTFAGIGSALYAYEPWLDDPKAHTYEDLKARITEKLKHAISGHLGEIEKSSPKSLSLQKILQKFIFFVPLLIPPAGIAIAPYLIQRMTGISPLEPTAYGTILFWAVTFVCSIPLLISFDKEMFKEFLEVIKILLRGKN